VVLLFATKCIISIAKGIEPYKPNERDDASYYLDVEIVYFHLATALAAILLSAGTLAIFGAKAESAIRIALLASPTFLIVVGFDTVFNKNGGVGKGLMLMVMGLFSYFYAVSVWHRIPFAASNLATAVTAVKANLGLLVLAYAIVFLTIGWTLLWFLALGHSYIQGYFTECTDGPPDQQGGQETECDITTGGYYLLFFFLLSFYWTSQVLKNILHATVAGVVGTWWFVPPPLQVQHDEDNDDEDNHHIISCCSQKAIGDSLWRSMTYSFGSLCLGSLVVALVQVLQLVIRFKRGQEEERRQRTSLVWCLLECVVNQLERLLEFINKWAFGMYITCCLPCLVY
jgi:hypothetical protein